MKVTPALVAPVGNTTSAPAPSEPKPVKVRPSVKGFVAAPGPGSAMDSDVTAVPLLVPVRVTVLGSPARTWSGEKVLPAVADRFAGRISWVSLAGADVAFAAPRRTLNVAVLVTVSGSVSVDTLGRWTSSRGTVAVVPAGRCAPVELVNSTRTPRTSSRSIPAGSVGCAPTGPATHADPSLTKACAWSASCGNVTVPKPANARCSNGLGVAAGSAGSVRVRDSTAALDLLVALRVAVAEAPGTAGADAGSMDLVTLARSARGTVGVTVASSVAGPALVASAVAVLTIGMPLAV